MILITGAGGTVGQALTQELLQRGARVRLAFHTPSKADAARAAGRDVVLVDMTQPSTLAQAMEGVTDVFLLGVGARGQLEAESNVIRAARGAGVRKLVKLSVWRAAEEAFSFARVHRPIERVVEESGMAWTHLRPTGFMQNVGNFMGHTIRSQNALYDPAGDARISHVDVRDIARVAAAALISSRLDGQALEITGPEAITYSYAAEVLSAVLGRKISYVKIRDEDAQRAMVTAGIPEFYAQHVLDLNRFYREGGSDVVTSTVEDVTGRAPGTFESYVRDHAAVFR